MIYKKYIQLIIIFLIALTLVQCNSKQQSHKCGAGQNIISQDTISAPFLSPEVVLLPVDSVLDDNQLRNPLGINKDCTYTKYPKKI